jgi:hypothetical protein
LLLDLFRGQEWKFFQKFRRALVYIGIFLDRLFLRLFFIFVGGLFEIFMITIIVILLRFFFNDSRFWLFCNNHLFGPLRELVLNLIKVVIVRMTDFTPRFFDSNPFRLRLDNFWRSNLWLYGCPTTRLLNLRLATWCITGWSLLGCFRFIRRRNLGSRCRWLYLRLSKLIDRLRYL